MKTATYVDGGYLRHLVRDSGLVYSADYVERVVHACTAPEETLIRALYYDSKPYQATIRLPVSGQPWNESPPNNHWIGQLARKPFFDVRLGRMEFRGFVPRWVLAKDGTPSDDDFKPDFKEKEVDVMMAVDIVQNAMRKTYDRIVVMSADADLIPALRAARQEGVQVVIVNFPGSRLVDKLCLHADLVRDAELPVGAAGAAGPQPAAAEAPPSVKVAELPLEPVPQPAPAALPPVPQPRTPDAPLPAAGGATGAGATPGQVVRGHVTHFAAGSGAILSLDDGRRGAIPGTEIDWKREFVNPTEVLRKGQEVEAKVVDADPVEGLVRLSLRRMEPDPWENIEEHYTQGQSVRGKTTRPSKGDSTIVVLEEGFEGIISSRKLHWKHDRVKSGEDIEALVVGIDTRERRVQLSPIRRVHEGGTQTDWPTVEPHERAERWQGESDGGPDADDRASRPAAREVDPARREAVARVQPGEIYHGTVNHITDYGAFVDIGEDLFGLVHRTNLSWRHVHRVSDIVNVGDAVDVQVLEVDREGARIALGMKQLEKDPWEGIDQDYSVGQRITGRVLSTTDYGAFVEVRDGVSGLLHMTDLSWRRVRNVTDVVNVDDEVEVVILEIDPAKRRMSLGLKQLQEDPWEDIGRNYTPGKRVTGRISNIADYGAFVSLGQGVDGLVHVSELDWVNRGLHPADLVRVGEEVEVMIIDVDKEKRRIALSLKRCKGDPWEEFEAAHPEGSVLTGTVSAVMEYGLVVDLPGGPEGLVRLTDLSDTVSGEEAIRNYTTGMGIDVVVLEVDSARERILLGVRQLSVDAFSRYAEDHRLGDIVTGKVTAISPERAEVRLSDKVSGFLPVGEASEGGHDKLEDVFQIGDEMEFKLIDVDLRSRALTLSLIQAMEEDEDPADE